ncbi:MAG: RNA methyltransferase [Clostridia bacterium]|nr:RNA methyltransferase [Clostridia bacterium]
MIFTEKITSRNNDRIKYAIKIKEKESFRRGEGLFLVEGARLCYDAALSDVGIAQLYVTPEARERYADYVALVEEKAERCFEISGEVAQKLADTKSTQGVFCLCKMLDKNTNIGKIKYNGKYIALEDVSNPSNFGAVIRTAEAVGLDGVIVSGGCDLYNPKSLRASMGSVFRLNVVETDNLPEFLKSLANEGMFVYAGVPDSNAESITEVSMAGGGVSIIGNEGNGITEETLKAATKLVTIPMKGRAESLNAAAAASIMIWEMMR